MFDPTILSAAKQHAISSFPNESVGIVTDAGYVKLQNVSLDPTRRYDCAKELAPYLVNKQVKALIHSHPSGPNHPSAADMAQQAAMAIPYGLIACNAHDSFDPWFWGDMLEPPPLLNREFRHGPSGSDGRGDCYALVRDYYRLERGVVLPDFPRDWEWWNGDAHQKLYEDNFAKAGFREADRRNPLPGDVVLMRYPPTQSSNHAGIFTGNQMLMHHLPNRFSIETPIIRYMRLVTMWLRYVG